MAKRRKKKGKRKNIYFGPNSVFKAVEDIGKPGLHSREEFVRLVLTQLLDLADLKTKNRDNETIPFTKQLWNQRCFVLRQLNKKKNFKCGRMVKTVCRAGNNYIDGKIGLRQLVEIAEKYAKKYKVKVKELEEITRKVVQQRKILSAVLKDLDGRIKKTIEAYAKSKGVKGKHALKRAIRLGKAVARRTAKLFDSETKRIAAYLWDMIPERYKRKPLRIWYYVMVLHLARYIRELAARKSIDWRAIDWATEIDWKAGYKYAKSYVLNLLRTGLERYEGLTEKEVEEMMKYYESLARQYIEA